MDNLSQWREEHFFCSLTRTVHLFEAHEAGLAVGEKTRVEVFPRWHQYLPGKHSLTSGRGKLLHVPPTYIQEYSFQRHSHTIQLYCWHELLIQGGVAVDPEQTIGVIGEDFEKKRNSLTVTSEQLKNSRQNPTTSFSNSATAIGGGITTAAGTKPLSVTFLFRTSGKCIYNQKVSWM